MRVTGTATASFADGAGLRAAAAEPRRRRDEHGAPWWPAPSATDAALTGLMVEAVQEVAGPLAEPLLRVVRAGGKRLRPALTVATAAHLGGGLHGEVLRSAAAVELLHCATLVHDDLIDGAATRRGVPTVSATDGPAAAVVGGDMLIAAALLLAGATSPGAGVVVAQALGALCRGEAVQERSRWRPDTPLDSLVDVARLKTGTLLQAACFLGADCAGAPPDLRAATGRFGMDFGISLQLLDDLLDIASTPALSGKPVGEDFATGTLTMPAALAIRDDPLLAGLFRPDAQPAARRRAVTLLRASDRALAATVTAAREHALSAERGLIAVSDGSGGAPALAHWPTAYLDSQLATMLPGGHRWLPPTPPDDES